MGKIGMGELLLILVIAIVVLGPDKVPQVARALGKGIRSVKKYIHETTKDLEDIQELKDLQKDVTDIQKDLKVMGQGLEHSLKTEVQTVENDIASAEEAITSAVEAPEAEPAETDIIPETVPVSNTTQEESNNG